MATDVTKFEYVFLYFCMLGYPRRLIAARVSLSHIW